MSGDASHCLLDSGIVAVHAILCLRRIHMETRLKAFDALLAFHESREAVLWKVQSVPLSIYKSIF